MSKIFMAVLLALLIAGGAYWYWTGTPQYSMLKIFEAVKSHDLEKFRTYFDVETVASHAVDDLSSSSSNTQDIGGPGLLARLLGRTLGGLLKPELSHALANKINNYVAGEAKDSQQTKAENKGSTQSEESNSENDNDGISLAIKSSKDDGQTSVDVPGIVSISTNQQDNSISVKSKSIKGLVTGFLHKIGDVVKFPSLRDLLQEIGLTRESYRGLSAFQTDGKFSHVSLRFQPADRPEILVELELLESEHHWRVVRFSNLAQLSKTVPGFYI